MKKEALRLSTMVPTAPTTLYLAWLNAEQHSAMTGGVAKMDPQVGGKFTTWNGLVSGKLVILDLGRRIVMSWRTTDFPREAPDSRVELHLEALGGSTRVLVLHTEIPEGVGEKCREVWNDKYFTPMRNFFSKYLPDPRKPPPPRRPPPPEEEEEVEVPKKGKLAAKPVPAKAPVRVAAPAKVTAKSVKPAAAKVATKTPSKAPPPPKAKPAPKVAAKPAPKKVSAKPVAKKPAKPVAKKPAPKAKGKKK